MFTIVSKTHGQKPFSGSISFMTSEIHNPENIPILKSLRWRTLKDDQRVRKSSFLLLVSRYAVSNEKIIAKLFNGDMKRAF